MNYMRNSILALGVVCLLLTSCKEEKKVETTVTTVETTANGAVHKIDTAQSYVDWRGYKLLKSDQTSHYGKIKFESGQVTVLDGQLESGTFVANMASLASEDLNDKPEQKTKLDSHLKSEDFFEVTKFPTATYEITKITPLTSGNFNTKLDGNLTIKGVTKPVSMEANVKVDGNTVTINSKPTDINRREFGVNFTSPAENGVIKDEVTLQITAVANLAQ